MAMKITRLGGAAGAEVTGLDLSKPIDDATFARILDAFDQNLVLVFRDQTLTPRQQMDFSRRIGPPVAHVLEGFRLPDTPEVFVVSNKKEGDKPKGAIYAGQYWHTDLSYVEQPALGSMLHALEVPRVGGDTMFANMYLAYDTLSEPMKGLLGGLTAVHDYALAYETVFSKLPGRPPMTDEERKKVPPVTHPVIRTHPRTKKPALYVNPGFTRRIVELSEGESQAVLDYLFEHSVRYEFVYRHKWRVGDAVLWDNRCTMHRAVSDYDMAEPRHMHRTTIEGDRPYH
jgi:taurine dioxygenase